VYCEHPTNPRGLDPMHNFDAFASSGAEGAELLTLETAVIFNDIQHFNT
jgi:hypothetical protein